MTDFTGAPCPICEKNFKKDERPVICTYCGAPYHRGCYDRQGFCVYTDAHRTGFVWKRPADVSPETLEPDSIKKSGYSDIPVLSAGRKVSDSLRDGSEELFKNAGENANEVLSNMREVLEKLGFDFSENNGLPSAEERFIFGVSEKELAHFHGGLSPMRLLRYRKIASGHKISPNFFALLFSPFYIFYTRMKSAGFVVMFVSFVLSLPTVIAAYFYNAPEALPFTMPQLERAMSAFSLFNFALTIFIGLFFDYFYLRWSARKIKMIRNRFAPDALDGRAEIPDAPSVSEKLQGLNDEYYICLQAAGSPGFRYMLLDSLTALVLITLLYNVVISSIA